MCNWALIRTWCAIPSKETRYFEILTVNDVFTQSRLVYCFSSHAAKYFWREFFGGWRALPLLGLSRRVVRAQRGVACPCLYMFFTVVCRCS